jgi:hypothetical protein
MPLATFPPGTAANTVAIPAFGTEFVEESQKQVA